MLLYINLCQRGLYVKNYFLSSNKIRGVVLVLLAYSFFVEQLYLLMILIFFDSLHG